MLSFLLMTALSFMAIFLIGLVLIQRGRGGGLAGALGGLGGQSAFGTKAGDVFTRITIGAAAIWIILCALAVKLESGSGSLLQGAFGSAAEQKKQPAPQGTGEKPASPEGGSSAAPAASGSASEAQIPSAGAATEGSSPASAPASEGSTPQP